MFSRCRRSVIYPPIYLLETSPGPSSFTVTISAKPPLAAIGIRVAVAAAVVVVVNPSSSSSSSPRGAIIDILSDASTCK